MKVVKVLGSERVYLMDDGSKIPFGELGKTRPVVGKPVFEKPKKKRKYKRKKKVIEE